MVQKIKNFIQQKKAVSALAALIIILGGYFIYGKFSTSTAPPRYIMMAVQKGTVITSVTGSGQISASNQVDIKSKASGDALQILANNGKEVKAGDVLVQLNARDAYKAVRDAAVNLQSARLSLEKTKAPPTDYSLIQSQNSVDSARTSLEKLKISQQTDYQKAQQTILDSADTIKKAYDDAYTTIASTFIDLPDVVTGLHTIPYSYEIGASEMTIGSAYANDVALGNSISDGNWQDRDTLANFFNAAKGTYQTSKTQSDAALAAYKSTGRGADTTIIDSLLQQTLEAAKSTDDTIKNETNALSFWVQYRTSHSQSIFAKVTSYQTTLGTYTTKINKDVSDLYAIQQTIKNSKNAKVNAERDLVTMDKNNPLDLAAAEASVKEKEASLANLQSGALPIDIQSQQLSVQQRANSLYDAQEKLSDYSVKAPFDGVVTKLVAQKGDSISSGATVATLLTKQQQAQISLNEVDVAKIKVAQKATLTFDAVDALSITGQVAEIDAVGTVSQGVVTYSVKILFDTQDDRIKPGMSVSAAIITNVKTDVLTVPNSALKTQGNNSYVEMFDQALPAPTDGNPGSVSPTLPRQQTVEIGLSNDTDSEIITGLKEGDQIVTRTIVPTTAKTTAPSATSLLGGAGGNRGGAGGGANAFRRAGG